MCYRGLWCSELLCWRYYGVLWDDMTRLVWDYETIGICVGRWDGVTNDNIGNIKRWNCFALGLETGDRCDCVTEELLVVVWNCDTIG